MAEERVDEKLKDTTNISIPYDLLVSILSRLDLKQLSRFRCVCKHWRWLITEDPYFFYQQQKNSSSPPKLINRAIKEKKITLIGTYPDEKETQVKSYMLQIPPHNFYLSNSVNGLVCTYNHSGNLHLLNPTTREVCKLPSPLVDVSGSFKRFCEVWLGFDILSGKYKLLGLTKLHHRPLFKVICQILTVGDKCWRHVSDTTPLYHLDNTRPVHLHGVCYWAATGIDRKIWSIYTFDIKNEKFGPSIPVPDVDSRHIGIKEMKGQILLVKKGKNRWGNIKVWMLNDIENHIWIKSSILDDDDGVKLGLNDYWTTLVAFTDNDIFFEVKRNMLGLYDTKRELIVYRYDTSLKTLREVYSASRNWSPYDTTFWDFHMESLISPGKLLCNPSEC